MKTIPQIQKYMTAMPHTIGFDMSIPKAMAAMSELKCRHLPVLKGGQLVGVVTDRDIKLATSFGDADKMKVEEIMTPEPYCVAPEAHLDVVVKRMAEGKLGCALVQQQNGKLVGIFTLIDALAALEEVLHQHYKQA